MDTPKHRMPLELFQQVLTYGLAETYSNFREGVAVLSLELPSWVPRWGWDDSAWSAANTRNLDKFNAAAGVPWMAERSDDGALVVNAVLLDSATILFADERLDMYLSLVYGPKPELVALNTVRKWRSAYSDVSALKDPNEQSLGFWRTLTFDSFFDGATASREATLGNFSTESPMEATRRWNPGDIQHAVAADAWLENPVPLADTDAVRNIVANGMPASKLFSTPTGRVGMARPSAQNGDLVALLGGLSMPALLRPVHKSGRNIYQFVGVCYCDGR